MIELATPHLVAHAPERIRTVVLAAGEAPDPTWLRRLRRQLPATPVRVVIDPAFGYASEVARRGRSLRDRVQSGVRRLLEEATPPEGLIWAHNLGLGRNLDLARELTVACHDGGVPLVVHHHDWWFENRWHHFAASRPAGFRSLPAVAKVALASSPWIAHVAINRADAVVLKKHFGSSAGWLPNPIEPGVPPSPERVEAARRWLRRQLGGAAPVWLMPCRLLRRKNIAEALLLTRWLRPEAWVMTTAGVSSRDEQAYGDILSAAAQAHGWRLRLGVLQGEEAGKPSVSELLAASEAVLLTSLQEGFGLPYLEAAVAQRPLVGRALPNIAPDLAQFGFKFPQYYDEVWVDPGLFDWRAEQGRQARLFADWKRLLPRAVSRRAGRPMLLARNQERVPVAFSRLTLTAQLEVLAQPVARSWERCAALNPCLREWRERAARGRLKTTEWPASAERWLGGRVYARRFFDVVPSQSTPVPPAGAGRAAQDELLKRRLRPECLYPLWWDSRA